MIVYRIVMILCCILLYVMRNDSNKVKPLVFTFGLIFLMIALQQGWGGDFDYYFEHFDYIKGLGFFDLLKDDTHGEMGYKIFMWIMPSYQAGFAAAVAIWCFTVAFFFYHFVPQKWWFFAILFIFWDRPILMGMVASFARMGLANVFLIYSLYLVSQGKRWQAVLAFIPACFFHKSVLLLTVTLLLPIKQIKGLSKGLIILILLFVILTWFAPSLWVGLGESLVSEVEVLSDYSGYLDNDNSFQMRGISLLVFGYWIYLLIKYVNKESLSTFEYLMLYCALVRIIFNLLPAVGLSVRFFYFIDLHFFAGMMCLMNRLPKGDVNRWGVALSLIAMFWFMQFHIFLSSPFCQEHWNFYNFIF